MTVFLVSRKENRAERLIKIFKTYDSASNWIIENNKIWFYTIDEIEVEE